MASEVRNLAQRSAAAAKEIKELISDSTSKVDAGTALVDQAGRTMDEIVASVKRVTDIMSEITAASHEQSTGIEEVGNAITQMDEVTQQNAALVEQAAAAAETLAQQAHHLMDSVSIFKVNQEAGVRQQLAETPKVSLEASQKTSDLRPRVTKLRPHSMKATSSMESRTPRISQPKKVAGAGAEWEEF